MMLAYQNFTELNGTQSILTVIKKNVAFQKNTEMKTFAILEKVIGREEINLEFLQ